MFFLFWTIEEEKNPLFRKAEMPGKSGAQRNEQLGN